MGILFVRDRFDSCIGWRRSALGSTRSPVVSSDLHGIHLIHALGSIHDCSACNRDEDLGQAPRQTILEGRRMEEYKGEVRLEKTQGLTEAVRIWTTKITKSFWISNIHKRFYLYWRRSGRESKHTITCAPTARLKRCKIPHGRTLTIAHNAKQWSRECWDENPKGIELGFLVHSYL